MYFKSPAPDAHGVIINGDVYPIQDGVFFVHPDDPNYAVAVRAHEQAEDGPDRLRVDAPLKASEAAHAIDEAVLADLAAARQRIDELEKELAVAEKRAAAAEAKLEEVGKAAAGDVDGKKDDGKKRGAR